MDRAVIHIAAALMDDGAGRTLLVRKSGTDCFMQPGGKMEGAEDALTTLRREIHEEIGFDLDVAACRYLGRFSAPAAHEPGWIVTAELFHVLSADEPIASSEIAEARWVYLDEADRLNLAPLTRDHVLPLARTKARLIGGLTRAGQA